METKAFGFKASKLTESGSFTGLLSVYGNVDSYDDVVMAGAFRDTLREKGNQRPLLWQHNPDNPIGSLTLEDRADGLYAKGQLLLTIPQGQIAYELLKANVLTGMSIGYTVPDGGAVFSRDGKRQLNRIDLFEGSLVTFPANDEARIDSVKKQRDDATRAVLDALDGQMKKWRDEIAVKDTFSILFAINDAEMKIRRINELVKEGF